VNEAKDIFVRVLHLSPNLLFDASFSPIGGEFVQHKAQH
jgi:hypothetical protein